MIDVVEKTGSGRNNENSMSSIRSKEKSKKDKAKALTKVVIRRLPPTMTEEEFLKQIEPLPPHDFYYYVNADWSLGFEATCRAYINFKEQDDIFLFKDRFDGYEFVDIKGVEYPAVVEFAPFQGFPKNRSRKTDPKAKTIESDPHYISFLEKLANEENEKSELKLEFNLQSNRDNKITSTPLLQYLANKKQERRDDRKRKTEEKRRQRDEDRQKKKITIIQKNTSKDEDNKNIKDLDNKSKEKDRRADKGDDKRDRGDEKKDRGSDKKDRHDDRKERYEDRRDRYDDRKDRGNDKKDRFDDRKDRFDDRRDRYDDRRNRHNDRRDRFDDRKDRYDDRRERYDDHKDSKSKRRAERDQKKREKKLESKVDKEELEKASENKPKEIKKYSESRKEKLRSREIAKESEKTKPLEEVKPSTSGKKSEEEINENVQEFIKAVANNNKGFIPKTQHDPSESGSQTTEDKKKFENLAEIKTKLENIKIYETGETDPEVKAYNESNEGFSRSNSIGNDKNKDDRETRRIRNKDRPSLQIYQPGKSRLVRNNSDGKADAKEAANSASDCESTKSRTSAEKDERSVKKRVSRYSERRSNKTKDRSAGDDGNDDPYKDQLKKRGSIESNNSGENNTSEFYELISEKSVINNEKVDEPAKEIESATKDEDSK